MEHAPKRPAFLFPPVQLENAIYIKDSLYDFNSFWFFISTDRFNFSLLFSQIHCMRYAKS